MALPMRLERGNSAIEMAHEELNNFFSRFLGGGVLRENGGGVALATLPRFGVDIREDAEHVYVEADLPGFRKEDIEVTLENGMLTITAERREEIETSPERGRKGDGEQEGNYLLRERNFQRVVRSFTLPPSVEEQDVQAKLDNGVLRITLNKRAEAKPKKIKVG